MCIILRCTWKITSISVAKTTFEKENMQNEWSLVPRSILVQNVCSYRWSTLLRVQLDIWIDRFQIDMSLWAHIRSGIALLSSLKLKAHFAQVLLKMCQDHLKISTLRVGMSLLQNDHLVTIHAKYFSRGSIKLLSSICRGHHVLKQKSMLETAAVASASSQRANTKKWHVI